jgi:hypothetical protein
LEGERSRYKASVGKSTRPYLKNKLKPKRTWMWFKWKSACLKSERPWVQTQECQKIKLKNKCIHKKTWLTKIFLYKNFIKLPRSKGKEGKLTECKIFDAPRV